MLRILEKRKKFEPGYPTHNLLEMLKFVKKNNIYSAAISSSVWLQSWLDENLI